MRVYQSRTPSGFAEISFCDYNGTPCEIKKSSLADSEAIWLGLKKAEPLIMASTITPGKRGWMRYDVPDDVRIGTHMHLSREQVKALLPILERFVKTGDVALATAPFDASAFPDYEIPGFAEACKNAVQYWEDFRNVSAITDECKTDNPRAFAAAVYPIFVDEMSPCTAQRAMAELISSGIADAPAYAPDSEN